MHSSTCDWERETIRVDVFDSMHCTLHDTKATPDVHNMHYRTEASPAKTSQCTKGRRITTAHIGGNECHPLWEFYTQREFELLAKLDKLEVLIL